MEKWPLRICCALALFATSMRHAGFALDVMSTIPTAIFWAVSALISLILALIVLVQGVR